MTLTAQCLGTRQSQLSWLLGSSVLTGSARLRRPAAPLEPFPEDTMTSTLAPAVLALESRVHVGTLDAAWQPEASAASVLRVDMSGVSFIEVSGMQYLCARMAQRASAGLDTRLVLPAKREVREHLRNWRFPAAAVAAVGAGGFRALVEPASHWYFGERQQDPGGVIGHGRDGSGLLPPHYFRLTRGTPSAGRLTPNLRHRRPGDGSRGTCSPC